MTIATVTAVYEMGRDMDSVTVQIPGTEEVSRKKLIEVALRTLPRRANKPIRFFVPGFDRD